MDFEVVIRPFLFVVAIACKGAWTAMQSLSDSGFLTELFRFTVDFVTTCFSRRQEE